MLTICLSKGRLAEKILDILIRANLITSDVLNFNRELLLKTDNINFLLAKPSDVPTFVEYGIADLGVVGKDTILEEKRNIIEYLDLGFGKCRMCICGKKKDYLNIQNLRIATKYPNITKDYFDSLNKSVNIIKLNGSVELACVTNLSDIIVDIVESGRTLKENGLEVLDTVCDISARLIINPASMKTKNKVILELIDKIIKNLGE